MRHLFALALVLVPACRSTPGSDFEAPVEKRVLVRVVDTTGKPVPHAEVLAGHGGDAGSVFFDVDLAGPIRAVDRLGRAWSCDEQGEVWLPGELGFTPVVARTGTMWGCYFFAYLGLVDDPVTVVISPDESVRAIAVDSEDRPVPGALLWISVGRMESRAITVWSSTVERADGTVEIPHAQYWRRLVAEGLDIQVLGVTLWGSEMDEQHPVPFPPDSAATLRFVVSPSGGADVDVRTADGTMLDANGELWLRWLDAPQEPQSERHEVPEFPFAYRGEASTAIAGIPLDHRYELVLRRVDGWVEAHATFEGPKRLGEHVRVELVMPGRSAVVTGRLVDEAGRPLANRSIDVEIERAGDHVASEDDWLYSDADGRFGAEFTPLETGAEIALVLETSTEPRQAGMTVIECFGTGDPYPRARRSLGARLAAGLHDLGDVRCVPNAPE